MQTTIQIQNLKCQGCASTIIKNLKEYNGIHDVSVDNETDTITLETGEGFNREEVEKRLFELGYPVINDENNLITKAKSYVSCMIGRMDPVKDTN